LPGEDRAVLYSVVCATGFRVSERASLCPEDFALEQEPATSTLAAENAKNGRTAVQPLPPDLVETLREYLARRPAGRPVWPGTWAKKAAEMISLDLAEAGIPYVTDGPDGPLYADFHALRHSFIALLDRSGAALKEAMQLARHSDPKLTMVSTAARSSTTWDKLSAACPPCILAPRPRARRWPRPELKASQPPAYRPACALLAQAMMPDDHS
jgi:integrase